jgi:hypothetical protein
VPYVHFKDTWGVTAVALHCLGYQYQAVLVVLEKLGVEACHCMGVIELA